MNPLPENSLRIYDVTFSNIIFNRISINYALCISCFLVITEGASILTNLNIV